MTNNKRVPKEVKKWNWGGFFLSFIWGIAHRVYFSLLFFIPVIGGLVPIILGFKGSEWAWKNNNWGSVEEFKRAQEKWARAGIIVVGGTILMAVIIVVTMFYSFGRMEPVEKSLEKLNNNPIAVSYLGNDIKRKSFWVLGSFTNNGVAGRLEITFPVEGEDGEGKVYLLAKKEMGEWEIIRLVLEIEEENYRLDLSKDNSKSI